MFKIHMKLQSQKEGGTIYKTCTYIKRQGEETCSKPNNIQALCIYLRKKGLTVHCMSLAMQGGVTVLWEPSDNLLVWSTCTLDMVRDTM